MFNQKIINTFLVLSTIGIVVWCTVEVFIMRPLLFPEEESADASRLVTVKRTLERWGDRGPFVFRGQGIVEDEEASPSAELEVPETIFTVRIVNASGSDAAPDAVVQALSKVPEFDVAGITSIAETDETVIEYQSTVPQQFRTEFTQIITQVHEEAEVRALSESSSDDIIILLGTE